MTQATKHTPTPWQAKQPDNANGWWVIADEDGFEIGSGDGGLEQADAAHIVRCVNAHDELVAAAERLGDLLHALSVHEDKSRDAAARKNLLIGARQRASVAFAALAKVQG